VLGQFHDLKQLCEKLEKPLYNPQNDKPQCTWRPLCSVMLGIGGKLDKMDDVQAIIDYQINKLGRIPGDSLLAELLPVPKMSSACVGPIPSRVLGIPDDIDKYRQIVLRDRKRLLAYMLAKRFALGQDSPPRLIVGYGKGSWSDFEAIFQEVRQMLKEDGLMKYNDGPDPGMVHDRPLPPFRWAKMKGCLFMLTYHPTARHEFESMRFGTPVAKEIVNIYNEHFKGVTP
jgi:hypothetical protein